MFCKQCGSQIKDTANFCPGCGAKIEKKNVPKIATVCSGCGAPLKAGVNFCKVCGTPVAAPKSEPEPLRCACGEVLKPGAKFCKGCGAPTAQSGNTRPTSTQQTPAQQIQNAAALIRQALSVEADASATPGEMRMVMNSEQANALSFAAHSLLGR